MNDMIFGIGPMVRIEQGNLPLLRDTTVDKTAVGIDRVTNKCDSCVLDLSVGVTSGSPTSFTADAKIQHADTDLDASYSDYVPPVGTGAVAQVVAASTHSRKAIDLSGAKQFIRVYHVCSFSGGASPKVNTATTVVLGGAQTKPAQLDT